MTRLIAALTVFALVAPTAWAGPRARARRAERREQRFGQVERAPQAQAAQVGGGVIPLANNVTGVEGVKRPPGAVGFKLNDTTFEFIGRNGQSLGVFPRDEDDIKRAGGANKGAANNGGGLPPAAPGGNDAAPGNFGAIQNPGKNPGGAVTNRGAKPIPFDGNRFNATFRLNPRDRIVAVEQIPVPRGAVRYRLSDTQVQFLDARGRSLGIFPRDEDDLKQPPAAQNPGGVGGGGNAAPGGVPPAAPINFASFPRTGVPDATPVSAPPAFVTNPFTNHVMQPGPGQVVPVIAPPTNDTHGDTGRAPAEASKARKRETAPESTEAGPAPVEPKNDR